MQTEAAERVLADFEGQWDLHRQIEHEGGQTAQFVGQAVWTPAAQGMVYRETGQLEMAGGPTMQAERVYLWGADLDVCFEDGRFFHRVPVDGGTARHWCDPDSYIVQYDFTRWPAFSTVWEVTGPRKAYRMVSQYSRR
ncbi:DUF6314 family protein [Roseobacter sp.]|uniref:DUF6314 family protein n=1 Tax=Roseobacter sp. TaxID=1907202 RepID=UPI002967155E|nr:DUF6314 family protein [Roseobacter sp.]MDW3182138.1 DUF6314 family protein [Roseobacter sp.]